MPLVEGTVVAVSVAAHDLVFLVIQSNLSDEASVLSLLTRTLPTALYSGLVGMPLLRIADFWGILRRED